MRQAVVVSEFVAEGGELGKPAARGINMATITIDVINESLEPQNFFIFEEPADDSGEPQVYSNSLDSEALLPHATSNARVTFLIQESDCQPDTIFYVQTGNYPPGTVVNATDASINAAVCDATSGCTTFSVTYNADGSWTVQAMASPGGVDGQLDLPEPDEAQVRPC
ncbi:hypothetical protein [Bradyrhizobium aeschynomenes]|uniref:hypothetical protein n=1 Tax=Bradyrhizobium aeschynomenes TaxID=2734909 RepID=UPI001AEF343C|nr:hypothetical protein [Bradyrhizobium aeschynomenes]